MISSLKILIVLLTSKLIAFSSRRYCRHLLKVVREIEKRLAVSLLSRVTTALATISSLRIALGKVIRSMMHLLDSLSPNSLLNTARCRIVRERRQISHYWPDDLRLLPLHLYLTGAETHNFHLVNHIDIWNRFSTICHSLVHLVESVWFIPKDGPDYISLTGMISVAISICPLIDWDYTTKGTSQTGDIEGLVTV